MSFAISWLDLRAPADAAARDGALLACAAAHLQAVAAPVVVDLGSGTGATVRAFGDQAPEDTRWRLVDHDADLLRDARRRGGAGIETVCADLRDPGALPLADARLVTASALFDLMPGDWIAALVADLARARIGLYGALSYDGMMRWDPAMPQDETIVRAFNAHQLRDKGLGPALGPGAADALAQTMRRRGFEVQVAQSPWRLGRAETALQAELVAGIGAAAAEMGADGAEAWVQARQAASGSATCVVGHVDVLALPPMKSQSKTTSVSRP